MDSMMVLHFVALPHKWSIILFVQLFQFAGSLLKTFSLSFFFLLMTDSQRPMTKGSDPLSAANGYIGSGPRKCVPRGVGVPIEPTLPLKQE